MLRAVTTTIILALAAVTALIIAFIAGAWYDWPIAEQIWDMLP